MIENPPQGLPARRPAPWTPTRSPAQIADELRRAAATPADRRAGVRIITHPKPDGDAVGSTLALARSLLHVGISSEVHYVGPLPDWATQIVESTAAFVYRPVTPTVEQSPTPLATAPSAPIPLPYPAITAVLDTGSWSQLAEQTAWLKADPSRVILIDHHVQGDPEVASSRLIDTSAASATQVLAPVCCALVGVESAVDLPLTVATPLYLGLATDTGWFKYSNVSPPTLRLAADLLQAGVDHTALYRLVEQRDTPARWRLLARALATLSIVPIPSARSDHGGLAIITLSPADFAEAGASPNDTGGFADMLLHIDGVKAAALLTDQPRPPAEPLHVKVSMRSKPGPGAIDVNAICRTLGGGGHIHAAGGRVKATLSDARAQLLAALP